MSENSNNNDDLLFYSTISFCANNHNVIDPKLFDNIHYNLIITGTLGVGKTTAIKLISNILKYNRIPVYKYLEYINYNNVGQELFQMKMNDKVSAFTFQNYILDIWDDLLTENDYKHSKGINIFERIPYDAVYCFSQKEYQNNKITSDEYDLIVKRYKYIINKHNMFEYSDDIKYTKLINNDISKTINDIFDIIIEDIKNGITKRCICLDIENKELYYSRLGIRNRTDEDKYTKQVLDEYKEYYSNKFSK
jgi:hypothetical protein